MKSHLGFKDKTHRSDPLIWATAMDDVRETSAWVATHSSHVLVDSSGLLLGLFYFCFTRECMQVRLFIFIFIYGYNITVR